MSMITTETATSPREANRRERQVATPSYNRGPWSWAWLLVGTALLPFANLQTLIPLAAWLAPVFLLRFTRSHRALVGLPVLVVAMWGALLFGLRDGFFPVVGGAGYYLFVTTLALGGALPFVVDRFLSPRLDGIARTLVFPAAVTTVELLGTFGNPSARLAARRTRSTGRCPWCSWSRSQASGA